MSWNMMVLVVSCVLFCGLCMIICGVFVGCEIDFRIVIEKVVGY